MNTFPDVNSTSFPRRRESNPLDSRLRGCELIATRSVSKAACLPLLTLRIAIWALIEAARINSQPLRGNDGTSCPATHRNWVAIVRSGLILMTCLLFLLGGSQLVLGDERGTTEPIALGVAEEIQAAESMRTTSTVPEWFEPDAIYADDVGMLFVRTDATCLNKTQAEEALKLESLRLVNKALDDWFGQQASAKIGLKADDVFPKLLYQQRQAIRLDEDPELAKLVKSQNLQDGLNYHVGFAQLHLNDEFRRYARERWLAVKTTRRLFTGGVVGGSLLIFLAVLFGYLKLESATRGFYSRRLQTASLVITLIVLAAAIWMQRLFDQL